MTAVTASSRGRAGLSLSALGTVLLLVAGFLVMTPVPAYAHHTTISATPSCDKNGEGLFRVDWSSTTWAPDLLVADVNGEGDNGYHDDIEIYYILGTGGDTFPTSWTMILDNGVYNSGNGGTITGVQYLPAGTYRFRAYANGPWGINNLYGGTSTATTTIDVGEGCTRIIIDKVTVPATGEDPNFTFNPGWSGTGSSNFTLDDNDTPKILELAAGTYTIAEESLPTGWSLTDITCVDPTGNSTGSVGTLTATIDLTAGETVTCTFTNSAAQIIIDKVTVPATGEDPNFTFNPGWSGSGSGNFTLDDNDAPKSFLLAAGPYTIAEESLPAGWSLTDITCVDPTGNSTGSVGTLTATMNVALGETVTCTFTNSAAQIIIDKVTVPATGEDPNFTFNPGWSGASNFTLDDNDTPKSFTLPAGPYTIAEESLPAGWSLTDLTCVDPTGNSTGNVGTLTATIDVALGETVTCTFTNSIGQIIIEKATFPAGINETFNYDASWDGGGSPDFTLNASSDTQDEFLLAAGTYSVTEVVALDPTYTLTSISCVDPTGNSSGNLGTATASIDVAAGETVTCTFTNSQAVLIIDKVTFPATGEDPNFTFNPGWSGASNFTLDDNDTPKSFTLPAGPYTIAEESLPAGWSLTGLSCVDPTGNSTGNVGTLTASINLAAGETVTCTFTNSIGQIIIEKATFPAGINETFNYDASWDGGGSPDFTLNASSDTQDEFLLAAGTYSVTEVVALDPTYTLTSISCVDPTGNSSGNLGTATASIDVAAGETVTCTFTNSQAVLIIDKVTFPATGEDPNFTFNPGWSGASNFTLDDNDTPKSFTLPAGPYTIAEESLPAGWSLTGLSCVDPTGNSTGNVGTLTASINLAAGETVTCTFTNANKGRVIIDKVTDPATGDDPDFTFDPSWSGSNFDLDDNDAPNAVYLDAGSYSVVESAESGWTLTGVSCVDPTANSSGNPATRTATINVAVGETVTCTFTNTVNGLVIIDKVTDPSSGDDPDFTFDPSWGSDFDLDDNDTPNAVYLDAGSYSVVESAESGWTLTGVSCVDPTANSSGNAGTRTATINVAVGETVTCTFTNTANGRLTVIKQTDPSGGSGFGFTTTNLGGASFSLADNGDQVFSDLGPGTYGVTEGTLPAGWEFGSVSCVDDDTGGSVGTPSDASVSVTLAAGQYVTCTFYNTELGKIIIEKQTLPDGNLDTTFDFSGEFTAILGDGDDHEKVVSPGPYQITEAAEDGWSLSGIVCDDANSSGVGATAMFNVEAGETVRCVFTNEEIPPEMGHIEVQKLTLPDDSLQTFGFTGAINTTLADGGLAGLDVVPGEYTVTEGAEAGWSLTDIDCGEDDSTGDLGTATATFRVDEGETVRCTFTNTQQGRIEVEKQTLPDGDLQTFDFSGSFDTALADDGVAALNVAPGGDYSATEGALPEGWTLTGIDCLDDNSTVDLATATATFNVEPGETVRCVFTNAEDGRIELLKLTLPGGVGQTFQFVGAFGNIILGDGGLVGLDVAVGEYSASEIGGIPNWDLTGIDCDDENSSGDLGTLTATYLVEAGETVRCVFTNTDPFLLTSTTGGGTTTTSGVTTTVLGPCDPADEDCLPNTGAGNLLAVMLGGLGLLFLGVGLLIMADQRRRYYAV